MILSSNEVEFPICILEKKLSSRLKFIIMLKLFRIVALLEGISYILLLFIATPVKYFLEDESYVKMLGMPHGVLFIAYIILAFLLKTPMKWSDKTFNIVLLSSILPFGTFYVEKKYLSNI